jgi:hypothetical protein
MRSPGIQGNISRTTDSPPSPLSNTPMGAAGLVSDTALTRRRFAAANGGAAHGQRVGQDLVAAQRVDFFAFNEDLDALHTLEMGQRAQNGVQHERLFGVAARKISNERLVEVTVATPSLARRADSARVPGGSGEFFRPAMAFSASAIGPSAPPLAGNGTDAGTRFVPSSLTRYTVAVVL